METKYKYKLAYKCKNQEEANKVLETLKELGYDTRHYSNKYSNHNNYILTNYGNQNNCFNFGDSYVKTYQRDVVDSLELFLALASVRDSDEFFIGEYVKVIKTNYALDHRKYKKEDIFQISEITQSKEYLRDKINGKGNGIHKDLCRKATKEEIISYFEPKKAKKDLIGIKFKSSSRDTIYTIIEQTDTDITLTWEPYGKTTRPISQYEQHIEQGIWIIVENIKENKMDKKIIGYKLVKEEYKEAASQIAFGNNKWLRSNIASLPTSEILKNAGVLDLWFEPVYEEILVEGKWYKWSNLTNDTAYVRINTNLKTGTGISILGNWDNSISLGNKQDWILMTKEEIHTVLISEATKRGFKQNTKYKGASFNLTKTLQFSNLFYSITLDVLTDGNGDSIYKEGKWAEILPSYSVGDYVLYRSIDGDGTWKNGDKVEKVIRITGLGFMQKIGDRVYSGLLESNTDFYSADFERNLSFKGIQRLATKEEYLKSLVPDIEVNGYKAEFFADYVKFGCAEFEKDFFIEFYNLGKKNIGNRTITSIKLGAGEFTFAQIKQIADYFENK